MARRRHDREYDVHLYQVVRVKVSGVQASDMEDAVLKVQDEFDWHLMFRNLSRWCETEYAEEVQAMLVDRVGDVDYEQTQLFNSSTNPFYSTLKEIVQNKDDPEKLHALLAMAECDLRNVI